MIHVTSHTEMRTGRWLHLPEQLLFETTMEIECKDMGMVIERNNQTFKMTKPFDLNILFDKLNHTPLLA